MTDTSRETILFPAMRESLSIKLLEILNNTGQIESIIERILETIKQITGFDAIGIRLRKDDDFPYHSQSGFSHNFLLTENQLSIRNKEGDVCRNADGSISLECTCGLVLSGKTDPANPLFTDGGSAWTNNSLPILDIPADQDPRLHPRNRCIHEGYRSIALIPIRNKAEIVGLLQLNDRRKDRFTIELIHFFESLSAGIGIALIRMQEDSARKKTEEKLQQKTTELEQTNRELRLMLENVKTLTGLLPICAHCKKIRDDKGYWNQIESYIKSHSAADFTHAICPACVEKYYKEYSNGLTPEEVHKK
jgi:GAF domain-containing protein